MNIKEEKITSYLNLELYSKGGATYYCNYYFYNGISSEQGTTKASGYGYDKQSTAASNALNKFYFLYKIKAGTKWSGLEHAETKKGHRIYGLYKDRIISYGIGLSSVLNCLEAFSNVKIMFVNYGQAADLIKIKITSTKKQLEKEIEKQEKIINNKKTTKTEKKEAKETINKMQELFNI